MHILTHRGLDPSCSNYFAESSYYAFKDQLQRGYGIEFDLNFTRDGEIIVCHDKSLNRITNGKDQRFFSAITIKDITELGLDSGLIPSFIQLMELIGMSKSCMNAIHLKGFLQNRDNIDLLLRDLLKFPSLLNRVFIFDIKPEYAKYIRGVSSEILLAPSVAHSYDISRYNSKVGGTLISLEEALLYREHYSWVWLDEWDLEDVEGSRKTFYNEYVMSTLRSVNYKIALVTPELHASSPGLLGGEAHEDGVEISRLYTRMKRIIKLKPDIICTDYPDKAREIYMSHL